VDAGDITARLDGVQRESMLPPANSQLNFAETSFLGGFSRRKNIDKAMSL
jgi:hypothetical protein